MAGEENKDLDVTISDETGSDNPEKVPEGQNPESGSQESGGVGKGEETFEIPERYAKDESFNKFVKDSDLTPAQIKAGIEYFEGSQAAIDQAYKDQISNESRKLKEEWGDELQDRMSTAKKAVEVIDKEVPGMVDFLKDTGAASHPVVIRMMEVIGRKLGEKLTRVKDEGKPLESEKPSGKNKSGGWEKPAASRLYPS